MGDRHYRSLPYHLSEIDHRYGPKVHILEHPTLMTQLARLCSPEVVQPEFSRLAGRLYQALAMVVANNEFPRHQAKIRSRMLRYNREGVYEGEIIDPSTRIVIVDIARAGMLPSQVCFEVYCELVTPAGVRQDHVFSQRATTNGRVTGAELAGSKIGGRFDDAILVVPDPMAATGNSLSAVLSHLKAMKRGRPRKIVGMHLIVTPEFLKRVESDHPEAIIYAIRLDRGLSTAKALAAVPGERWPEERGLNDRQYIVPGGGGFGELLSNAEE